MKFDKNIIKNIVMLCVIFLVVILAVSFCADQPKEEFTYSDLIEKLENNEVVSLIAYQDNVVVVKAYKYARTKPICFNLTPKLR